MKNAKKIQFVFCSGLFCWDKAGGGSMFVVWVKMATKKLCGNKI